MDSGAWWAMHGHQELDTTERLTHTRVHIFIYMYTHIYIYICISESLCYSPEATTTMKSKYTSIQKIV